MTLKRISPQEANELMQSEGYVYIDVRSIPEFSAGHPKGAYNVPLLHRGPSGMSPNGDFLTVVESSFPKDTKLVVGCQVGGRSLRAAGVLIAAGYVEVVDQRAGFGGARGSFGEVEEPGWQAAGLDVATGAEPGRSYEELAASAGKS